MKADVYPEQFAGPRCGRAKMFFTRSSLEQKKPALSLPSGDQPKTPYYEKAMMMRSIENTIYFASVNYALRFQESATTLIDPSACMPGLLALRSGGSAGAGN